ncbi:DsbA family protein [Paracoccus sulfuroxidans]|uniref:Protein-disulfide isomerase n=1 Tax=Paracoccus sulfuroxidans TaxID=384678 RepID=A0A562P167_9RHOB|nr:DsbA family protein [Paracoccus sulfuroxidans]TWI38149.1 protein-disulfide isomerase [Paracoccus sulfuroxidans]
MRRTLFLAIATLAVLAIVPALKAIDDPFAREITAEMRASLFEDPGAPVLGNPDGDVTLVEFTDYNCGFCRRSQPEIEKLLKADPNLRLVIRELPVFGEGSRFAAEAALAAGMQGKYAELHAGLMSMKGRADQASVLREARRLGLDVPRLQQDMSGPAVADHIAESLILADGLEIMGTPTWVIGERVIFGFLPASELSEVIAEARASATE